MNSFNLCSTRRDFLNRAVTGGAALMLAPSLVAASPAHEFDLGISLYGMKTVPLAEAVATCARIGYRNVELCLDAGYPSEPAKFSPAARRALRQQVESVGLTISGLMLNLNLVDPALHVGNLAAIKTAAQLAHDVQPKAPPPIETVTRGKPAEWESLKAGMAQRLRDWGDAAAASRVRMVVKAHYNMAVSNPDHLLWLLKEANNPSLAVAYDYSHFELREISMEESWRKLGPKTEFVHVKDTAGDAQKAKMLLPGDGRTDYRALFRLLRSAGYRGPVVVEVSSMIFNQPGYDPVVAAEKSYVALTKALAASRQ
jgi:sugar phosphate isomerase/epimerase